MPRYVISKKSEDTGEHELHTTFCPVSPGLDNCIYLGYFSSCRNALKEARKHFLHVDGCVFCSKECHTKFTFPIHKAEFNFKKH